MERQNFMDKEPEKEFYFIYYGDGSFNLDSAIGQKGGYVYYLIESKENVFDKNFRPQISPISNILDYCGLPDAQVISIDPKDPKTRSIYTKLSGIIDEYKQETEKVLN